jgi:hypothetical protein
VPYVSRKQPRHKDSVQCTVYCVRKHRTEYRGRTHRSTRPAALTPRRDGSAAFRAPAMRHSDLALPGLSPFLFSLFPCLCLCLCGAATGLDRRYAGYVGLSWVGWFVLAW